MWINSLGFEGLQPVQRLCFLSNRRVLSIDIFWILFLPNIFGFLRLPILQTCIFCRCLATNHVSWQPAGALSFDPKTESTLFQSISACQWQEEKLGRFTVLENHCFIMMQLTSIIGVQTATQDVTVFVCWKDVRFGKFWTSVGFWWLATIAKPPFRPSHISVSQLAPRFLLFLRLWTR